MPQFVKYPSYKPSAFPLLCKLSVQMKVRNNQYISSAILKLNLVTIIESRRSARNKLEKVGKSSEIGLKEISLKSWEKSWEKSGEKILRLIIEKPNITINELEIASGLSHGGIEKNIAKLKKEGKLDRIGPDKGGYWRVNN